MLLAAQVVYLFAPLLVSAAIVGWVLRVDALRALKRPIDVGWSIAGRRLFGDHKTWRVAVVTVAVSVATVAVQRSLDARVGPLQLVDYGRVSPLGFGAAMGGGAMLGELPNSYVKRRLGIAPGSAARGWPGVAFYVWDQVDLLTGVWPLLALCWSPPARVVAASFALALGLHPLVAVVGYAIGSRSSPR